jgi:hypothetical protein
MTGRPEGPGREMVDMLMDDAFEISVEYGVHKPEEYPGEPGHGIILSLMFEAREGCEHQIQESREWYFHYQRKQRDEPSRECVKARCGLWRKRGNKAIQAAGKPLIKPFAVHDERLRLKHMLLSQVTLRAKNQARLHAKRWGNEAERM